MGSSDNRHGKKESKTVNNSLNAMPKAGIIICENLPGLMELKKRLYALAILNIILLSEQDSWLRIHSRINGPSGQLKIYMISNGSGDSMFIIFSNNGCIIKGFDHESLMSPYIRGEDSVWPGIYDSAPIELLCLLDDPMVEKQNATFCFWRESRGSAWQKGNVINPDNFEDGHNYLLGFLFPSASRFIEWAKWYFGRYLPFEPAQAVYSGVEVDDAIISSLNPERDSKAALAEIALLTE